MHLNPKRCVNAWITFGRENVVVATLLWLQRYLIRKTYIVTAENQESEEKYE